MDWPLGQRESLKVEFKRADALKDPANVAREVVGFLNAEGGEIWIGVGETDGVADVLEAVPNPERQRARLQDALVDLIEPSPIMGKEVESEVVPFPADETRGLVRVRVSPGPRGPYALLRQTARAFLRRTGSRLRSMTREELAQAFQGTSTDEDPIASAVWKLRADLRRWADEGSARLRVAVRPAADLALKLNEESLLPLLRSPRKSGNRPLGWNFTSDRDELKPLPPDGYRFGEEGSMQWTSISARGDIEFATALVRLYKEWIPDSIWPLALLEFPASVARLARTLYLNHASGPVPMDTALVLGLGLFRLKDWILFAGSPGSISHQYEKPHLYEDADFLGEPVIVRWAELEASPDRCAYLLVRQVYQAFDFEERAIPQEYDRDTGQLTFPG